MQWNDEAIILSARAYGESAHIVQLFSPEQGRHAGMVKGRKIISSLQPGNIVQVVWKARLPEHLGMLQLEMVKPCAALVMDGQMRLSALMAACALVEASFPERDPHPEMYRMLRHFLEVLAEDGGWQRAYVDFEHQLLTELGFGLDLTECAATGTRDNLIYVSPKSGRAVSAEAGFAYKEKLFPLPDFFKNVSHTPAPQEILQGFRITGYFLEKCWEQVAHKPLSATRGRLSESFVMPVLECS